MTKISSGVLRLYTWIMTHKKSVALFAAIILICTSIPLLGWAQDPASSSSDLSSDVWTLLPQLVLGFLTYITNIIISAVGKLIVTLMGAIIIPILGYNNFNNSSVIDIGWPLVRDIVNMFVIVVLIVIAVQTILGYSKAKWEIQLPRFFIAVVLVNFSRTITLLMVDVSQVVMFTFVNALRDIAAGNFMSLFQLNEFVTVDSGILQTIQGSAGIQSWQLYATSTMTLGLLLTVLGTLIILVIVFLYRIVILWVLIILSPIAFFMGGVGDLFGEAKGKYGEWWSMLVAALTLGPILTFFLWLALAAASSGPLAVSEGMNFAGTSDVPSLFAKIFLSEKLLSLLLALILIMAGFKMASGAASKLGNFAAKLITEDAGKRLVTSSVLGLPSLGVRGVRAGGRAGWRAGKAVGGAGLALGKRAGLEAFRQMEARTELGQGLGKGITHIGSELSKQGAIGRLIGGQIIRAGGRVEATAAGSMEAGYNQQKEERKDMTMNERIARLRGMQRDAAGNLVSPLDMKGRNAHSLDLTDLATDDDLQDELKKQMSEEDYNKLLGDALLEANKMKDKKRLSGEQKSALKKSKNGNLTSWLEAKKREALAKPGGTYTAQDEQKELDKLLSDTDFRMDHLSENDVKDERVQEALKKRVMRTYHDQNGVARTESAWDQVEKGQGVSNKVKNAAQGFGATFGSAMAAELAQALKHGHLDIGSLTAADLGAPGSNREKEIAQAAAMSGADLGKLDPTLRAQVLTAIDAVKAGAGVSAATAGTPEERAKWVERQAQADRARFSAMKGDTAGERDAAAAHLGVDPAGVVDPAHRQNVREVITSQPTQIFKFETAIEAAHAGGTPNDITKEIVRTMSQTNIQQMRNELKKARTAGPAGAADEARIKKSIEMAMKAFEAESAHVTAAGGALDDETRDMMRKLQNLNRY